MMRRFGKMELRWVSTLDERTCKECRHLHGTIFTIGVDSPPPIHPNCRCTLRLVFKPYKQKRSWWEMHKPR